MSPQDLAVGYGERDYSFRVSSAKTHPPSKEGGYVPFSSHQLADLIHSRLFGGVCVEIGSGEGLNTVFLSNACRFSMVIAADGAPESKEQLAENLRANCSERIPIWSFDSFISDTPDVYYNLRSPSGKCPAFVSLVKVGPQSVPVKAVSLDAMAAKLPRIDLICIDADNHEMEVISSGNAIFKEHRPELCIRAGAGSWEMMDEYLGHFGYSLLRRFHDGHSYYVPDSFSVNMVSKWAAKLPRSLSGRTNRFWRRASLALRTLARFSHVDTQIVVPAGFTRILG